ncbi:hypothetical protein Q3W71_04335 [Micromonospora sp. C28SCA-DRY-2]|uniref:hypothetical protein n=1 Tax=Micromonospora sp. C28SCA-DRY-2 TaxID=3059522 RepID=UPI002675F9F7|nr:hypothetical protein [Micromonospora sp. C28SCA-DRY-2]MDO3700906.1 hypothetical protein [Micromonospora sp. C28SCA-DRY-2]
MAEEDLTRARAGATGPASHRASGTPARHRSTLPLPARAREVLGGLARFRQRRRWVLEGLTAVACLAALVSYLAVQPDPPGERGDRPDGLPAGIGRPSVFPGAELRYPATGPASPGLQPRQRPPSPTPSGSATSGPPVRPTLSVEQRDVPARVDLTASGPRDWIHWGLRGGDSTVRKRGGSGELVDAGGRGVRGGWDANQETFSWRDGAPVGTADGTPTGVYTCGSGSGFALAVAGAGEARTVRLYAGVWMARGRLEVRLSTGGLSRTLRMEDPHTLRSAEFTIRFQAPKGTRLLLNWVTEEVFTGECGSVSLQALALR